MSETTTTGSTKEVAKSNGEIRPEFVEMAKAFSQLAAIVEVALKETSDPRAVAALLWKQHQRLVMTAYLPTGFDAWPFQPGWTRPKCAKPPEYETGVDTDTLLTW